MQYIVFISWALMLGVPQLVEATAVHPDRAKELYGDRLSRPIENPDKLRRERHAEHLQRVVEHLRQEDHTHQWKAERAKCSLSGPVGSQPRYLNGDPEAACQKNGGLLRRGSYSDSFNQGHLLLGTKIDGIEVKVFRRGKPSGTIVVKPPDGFTIKDTIDAGVPDWMMEQVKDAGYDQRWNGEDITTNIYVASDTKLYKKQMYNGCRPTDTFLASAMNKVLEFAGTCLKYSDEDMREAEAGTVSHQSRRDRAGLTPVECPKCGRQLDAKAEVAQQSKSKLARRPAAEESGLGCSRCPGASGRSCKPGKIINCDEVSLRLKTACGVDERHYAVGDEHQICKSIEPTSCLVCNDDGHYERIRVDVLCQPQNKVYIGFIESDKLACDMTTLECARDPGATSESSSTQPRSVGSVR